MGCDDPCVIASPLLMEQLQRIEQRLDERYPDQVPCEQRMQLRGAVPGGCCHDLAPSVCQSQHVCLFVLHVMPFVHCLDEQVGEEPHGLPRCGIAVEFMNASQAESFDF